MPNREFLMLAQPYMDKKKGRAKYDVRGWWGSEKLDGIRAWWDGGISRRILKSMIPWANNTAKDARYVNVPIATGLWSRYGHPIYAPDWFLDTLPQISLDGELYIGRGLWQTTSSYVSKLSPIDEEWQHITFNVFEAPSYPQVFAEGRINSPNFSKDIDINSCMDFVRKKLPGYFPRFKSFEEVQAQLDELAHGKSIRVVQQEKIHSFDDLEERMNKITDAGGEGMMFRKAGSYWEPKRSHQLTKYKPFEDAEGIVIGFTWGRETDKGSKLLGKIGALILDYKGKRLELSGFTDEERVAISILDKRTYSERVEMAEREGKTHPGETAINLFVPAKFPIGSIVTFQYRELSDGGVPKEARYLRKREGHS